MPHPSQIPLTPQTDERNFPRWEGEKAAPGRPGARYPKMLTRPTTKEDRESWVREHRRVDQNTRQEYWEESPPRLHAPLPILSTQDMVDEGLAEVADLPVIVQSAEEEERIRVFLGLDEPPQRPQTTSIPIRQMANDWVDESPSHSVKKRAGRPKGAKNKPKLDVSD